MVNITCLMNMKNGSLYKSITAVLGVLILGAAVPAAAPAWWSAGLINDSMGFGAANDWDDGRTFGFFAHYCADSWLFSLDYTALTARGVSNSLLPVRSDTLDAAAVYSFNLSGQSAGGLKLLTRAGLSVYGSFLGYEIQTTWHGLLGLDRPVPDSYSVPDMIIQPLFTASLSYIPAQGGWEASLSAGYIHEAWQASAQAGAKWRLYRGYAGLGTAFYINHAGSAGLVNAYMAANDNGLWLYWKLVLGGVYFENRSNPFTGLLDYRIGITTEALDMPDEGSNGPMSVAIGTGFDRFILSSRFLWQPREWALDVFLKEMRLFAELANGELRRPANVTVTDHFQSAVFGMELELLPGLPVMPQAVLGLGFRTDQPFDPIVGRAVVINNYFTPIIAAGLILRAGLPIPFLDGQKAGLELYATALLPFRLDDPMPEYPAGRLDFTFGIRVLTGQF